MGLVSCRPCAQFQQARTTTMLKVTTTISGTPTKEGKRKKTAFNGLPMKKVAKILGFKSEQSARLHIEKGERKRYLIANGNEKGYELEVCDKESTKYEDGEIEALQYWIENDCIHVRDSPCKGEEVYKRSLSKLKRRGEYFTICN